AYTRLVLQCAVNLWPAALIASLLGVQYELISIFAGSSISFTYTFVQYTNLVGFSDFVSISGALCTTKTSTNQTNAHAELPTIGQYQSCLSGSLPYYE